jgi:phosphoribosylanthranilate isomerase
MLKRFVKVSNVTNLSVARYCAGMFVDLIGINVDEENENFIDAARFQEIRGWLSGISIVIETDSTDILELNSLIENYKPDFIQTKNEVVLGFDLPVEKIFEGDLKDFNSIDLDSFSFYQFSEINEEIISNLSETQRKKLIFSAQNIFDETKQLIDNETIMSFDLKAYKEQRPGFQDFDELMEILEYLDE